MEKIKKYFGEYNMTWPRVILLAIITAVYTAIMNEIPFLYDTSFRDIAVYPDCWILFALFIIVNCKKWWEASLKCFVFFLISQPLIYLIEVPFEPLGWGVFQYYRHWFIITVLTLPGAAIAFLVKKKNWISVLVLSVATGYLAIASVTYFKSVVLKFPRHLLSALFCLALAIFFIFVLLDKPKYRNSALAIFGAVFIAYAGITGMDMLDNTEKMVLDDGNWTCTVEDGSVVSVEITDGNHVTITPKQEGGNTVVRFKNDDGTEQGYYVDVSGGEVWTTLMDED